MVIRTEAGKFTVGNTADGGEGSLRQAILDANASGQSANIIFSVPGTGAPVIRPSGTLPTATVPVTIDGTTQQPAGFVVLDGGSAGAGANGFVLGGGNSLLRGLVISEFRGLVDSQTGTLLGGFGAALNGSGHYTMESCFIGTDSGGEATQANGLGVLIASNSNLIGGNALGTGNLISGNSLRGIGVGPFVNNVVTGNLIGTDRLGQTPVPNGGEGVFLNGSSNNTVGGNLISGNKSLGVELVDGASANLIVGNFIGTDRTSNQAIGNANFGVAILGSPNNAVGGTSPQQRNIISGNIPGNLGSGGVEIGGSGATGNLVQGNFIGTNSAGNAAVGNVSFGVFVGSSSNTIGGAVAGSGNLISATSAASDGISLNLGIEGGGTFGSNQVMGNLIGTDITGTTGLGSTQFGLAIDQSPNNTVGGTQPATGNLVSGHTIDGVVVANASSTGNLVEGNFIGTDITGKLCIPNKAYGLIVTKAPGNTITGNLISCNGVGGVGIGSIFLGSFGDSSTLLKGNFIGVDATLAAPLGNTGNGVFVENDSINNQVVGNMIAFNQGAGIRIPNDPSDPSIPKNPAVQIKLSSNQVYSNSGLGIDLGPPGPTPNPGNQLTGANRLQNYPEVKTAMVSGTSGKLGLAAATITVSGTLSASANTGYGLEFFLGGSCDSGQGHQFIGSIPVLLGSGNVSTDGTGNASYAFTFPIPSSSTVSSGLVNATATDPLGNTSEFSLCAPVSGQIPAGPVISSVQPAGKNLLVMGQNFDSGAVILKNGNPQRTLHDDQTPSTTLTGKKVNKNIAPGETVTIQVQNSDGSLSNQVTYTRPAG
jgi:titin